MANGQFTNFPIDWESITASSVPFDPGDTGLTATDVQGAIDALKALIGGALTFADDGNGNIIITMAS